jgi:hypothetical protein
MTPRKMRNAAEIEVPMIPPTRENESNRSEMEEAVAATTIEVTITILRMDVRIPLKPEGKLEMGGLT